MTNRIRGENVIDAKEGSHTWSKFARSTRLRTSSAQRRGEAVAKFAVLRLQSYCAATSHPSRQLPVLSVQRHLFEHLDQI